MTRRSRFWLADVLIAVATLLVRRYSQGMVDATRRQQGRRA